MKDFLNSLRAAIARFMSGRYGYDELSYFLAIIILISIFLSYIPGLQFISGLSLLLCCVLIFRSFSRNIPKRQAERTAYLQWERRCKNRFSVMRQAWTSRKTHRFYQCKRCKTYVRVPKGKGKIKITCPKCHNEFIKKT